MEQTAHEELVERFKKVGEWEFVVVKFEELGKREQFEMVADADVSRMERIFIVGRHGFRRIWADVCVLRDRRSSVFMEMG